MRLVPTPADSPLLAGFNGLEMDVPVGPFVGTASLTSIAYSQSRGLSSEKLGFSPTFCEFRPPRALLTCRAGCNPPAPGWDGAGAGWGGVSRAELSDAFFSAGAPFGTRELTLSGDILRQGGISIGVGEIDAAKVSIDAATSLLQNTDPLGNGAFGADYSCLYVLEVGPSVELLGGVLTVDLSSLASGEATFFTAFNHSTDFVFALRMAVQSSVADFFTFIPQVSGRDDSQGRAMPCYAPRAWSPHAPRGTNCTAGGTFHWRGHTIAVPSGHCDY